MITISEKAEEIINNSPYLREAITDRLVNLSSLARKIKPQIEQELMKEVTDSALFAALQRIQSSLKPYYAVNPAEYLDNLSLRSGIFEITVKNSSTLSDKLNDISKKSDELQTTLFTFTKGQNETTIITSYSLESAIDAALKDEDVLNVIPDLTAISMQRTHLQIETTGVLQYPLRVLAWEGISVIEIITTLNEMMIIVRDFEVDRAFVSIRKALQTVSKADSQEKK